MRTAIASLLLPCLILGQDWSRIRPDYIGYGSGTFAPGGYTTMARFGSDLIISGQYVDGGFHTSSVYQNHFARLRITDAETTLTMIKKNWWHNTIPGNGESIQDSSINLTVPTPQNRNPIFTVAGTHLYQISGQGYRAFT